jgi:WD40 repeat protein
MSIVRKLFEKCIPQWIKRLPRVANSWNALLQTLDGHSASVGTIAFSPDGKILASGSDDFTIKLWDAHSGKLLQTLKDHTRYVRTLSFSWHHGMLASGSYDNTVNIWDSSSGKLLRKLPDHADVIHRVAFSRDSKILASSSGFSFTTIKLWEVSSGKLLQKLEGNSIPSMSVNFSPDGQMLALKSERKTDGQRKVLNPDYTVELRDAVSGSVLQTLDGHLKSTRSLAFSQDGVTLASVLIDEIFELWDNGKGNQVPTLKGCLDVHTGPFSPDGKMLAVVCDETIKIWNIDSAKLQKLQGHSRYVTAIAFSPDSKILASASDDHTIKMWDVGSEKLLETYESRSTSSLPMAFSQDGMTLEDHSKYVNVIAFSPDGNILASASWDRTIKLWDPRLGTRLYTLDCPAEYISAVVFSPNSKMLSAASSHRMIGLWDVSSGNLLRTLDSGSFGAQTVVVFSQDSRTLATASGAHTIKLWDVYSGSLLYTLGEHSDLVSALVFSPDDEMLASASWDCNVKLWDVNSGTLIHALNHSYRAVRTVAFSQDGSMLASALDDDKIRLWNTNLGRSLRTYKGHAKTIHALAFSMDGKTLASASDDETIKLWDTKSQMLLQTLEVDSVIGSLSFSDDRTLLRTDRGSLPTVFLPGAAAVSRVGLASSAFRVPSPLPFPPSGAIVSRLDFPCSLFIKEQWVCRGMENILLLPSDYRPSSVAVYGSIVGLGYPSGRVTFMEFDF